jgi:hypothetical protein
LDRQVRQAQDQLAQQDLKAQQVQAVDQLAQQDLKAQQVQAVDQLAQQDQPAQQLLAQQVLQVLKVKLVQQALLQLLLTCLQ